MRFLYLQCFYRVCSRVGSGAEHSRFVPLLSPPAAMASLYRRIAAWFSTRPGHKEQRRPQSL